MRDAFGVQTESRYSGIVETEGLPTRPKLKNVEQIRRTKLEHPDSGRHERDSSTVRG